MSGAVQNGRSPAVEGGGTSTLDRARTLAGYDEVSALRQAQDVDWVLGLVDGTPASLLDLGCGTGALLDRARWHWPGIGTLAGVDGAPGRVAEARERLGPAGLIMERDLLALPDRGRTFEAITMTSVLHWLFPDEARVLGWIARHLAPDGSFVLTTHHPHVEDGSTGAGDPVGCPARVHGADGGLGAEDLVAVEALAELGVDGLGPVVPMARRARPVDAIRPLLEDAFVVDAVEEHVVPVRAGSADEYARFHASTFGTYFSRRAGADRQEAFFAAVGRAAARRQERDGAVYPITVRAWRGRPKG